jgi:hypothetical protein
LSDERREREREKERWWVWRTRGKKNKKAVEERERGWCSDEELVSCISGLYLYL